jgi:hypothetical protein
VRRAALALLLALAACGESAPPPALQAEVTQYRRDQALGQVQVKLTSTGGAVVVERLRLEARGFAPGPDVDRGTRLPPGRAVDLPTPYGELRCDEQPDGGRAVVTVRRGEQRHEVSVPVPGGGVLALVHDRECREAALQQAVRLSFAPAWPEEQVTGRPALLPVLVLERSAGRDRVVVDDVAGHVLFTVRPRDGRPLPLLVLEPDQQRAELPLQVLTTRCDGHALAESKRTPLFLFYVGLGEEPPRRVEVAAPTAVHGQLAEFAARSCGV